MEFKAICGPCAGGRIFRFESGAWTRWRQQHLSCTPYTKAVPLKTRRSQVRAVSNESKSALGRRARREQNVAGEFFVDKTCIDCDTCRWMSPTVFSKQDGMSAVYHQPISQDERLASLQALLACPTFSIHTVTPPKELNEVHMSFPLAIDPELPGVYHCGYHSELSFAATSYFITSLEGNIMVDSPRFSEKLALRLDEMGGVRYMFLTHKDDVADHKKWRARLNCERIIHSDEVTAATKDCEVKLEGKGNWSLGSDIELIATPGHTKGHVVLLLKDREALFTGDHLYASSAGKVVLDLRYCWYSESLQIDSVEALIQYNFTWILPGHGRRHRFQSIEDKNDVLSRLVSKEKTATF